MSIAVSIYTIEKKLFEEDVESVQLPGVDGELGVLPLHVPLVTVLKNGVLKIRRGSTVQEIPIRGGFVEVAPGSRVVVLADQ